MTRTECAERLVSGNNYLILTHSRPDGDTLGSAAALCAGLRALGKTAYMYKNAQITENHLYYLNKFFPPDGFSPESVIAVDTATVSQLPEGFSGNVDVSIDHHATNSGYAGAGYLDFSKASCGEIIFELLKELGAPITPEIADALYIAVSTDTGCFCYANTRPETLRAAADIIDLGANSAAVNKLFFRTFTAERLKLEGMIYKGLRSYLGGRVNVAVVTLKMLEESGASEGDCEDIAGLAGRVKGSVVSVTIRETERGRCRVSMRSSPGINVSDICAQFGGGGHVMAAGCKVDLPPEEAEAAVVSAIKEAIA